MISKLVFISLVQRQIHESLQKGEVQPVRLGLRAAEDWAQLFGIPSKYHLAPSRGSQPHRDQTLRLHGLARLKHTSHNDFILMGE